MSEDFDISAWPGLHYSAQSGDVSTTRTLLAKGFEPGLQDRDGWTAQEHAACQGHLDVARVFPPHVGKLDKKPRYEVWAHSKYGILPPLPFLDRSNPAVILVRLGPANTRNPTKAVELNQALFPPPTRTLGVVYMIKLTALHATGGDSQYGLADILPVSEGNHNSPIILRATDPDKVVLKFSLYSRTSGYAVQTLIGVGTASLRSLHQGHSSGRGGLNRDHSISILTSDYNEIAANVTINLLVARPYQGKTTPQPEQGIEHKFWTSDGQTQVIGHRGSGANTTAHTNLQLGENTVSSLGSAAALGATAVEFDVQLTKDFMPVIYHNFLVMETGGEATIWNLTKSQFVRLSQCQTSEPINDRSEVRYRATNGDHCRKRRRSVDVYDDHTTVDLVDRMKDTFAAKSHGIKGNLRGFAISDPFPTFKELLTQVPESVPFDLEMKYPMLWEAEDQDFEPYAVEANLFIDTVLELIYKHGGKRNITFSSFSPEMCILLKAKQQTHPIMFISKAGSVPTGDIRASSVQQAVYFAKRWDLAGVVLLSDPLVLCPRLIQWVKSAGLICASYGDLNDDPVNAKLQADHGLDAIIVNKVRLISQTLAKSATRQVQPDMPLRGVIHG